MAVRKGNHTILFERPITLAAAAAAVGKKEGEGPLHDYFDRIHTDTTLHEKSFERAEAALQKEAFTVLMTKAGIAPSDVSFLFAGDLLNQCISSTFGLQDFSVPLFGIYGACSTFSEGLLLAAMALEGGCGERAVVVTSSHFCTAERQFRFPLEYGGLRTPTSQWTATAAGAVLLGQSGTGPRLTAATPGIVTDYGVKDANNMGAAMAPAAAVTIGNFFRDTGRCPEDYDLIATGDLGLVGSELLITLLKKDAIDISRQHNDCGLMLYDVKGQGTTCGGSDCGCSASVFSAYLYDQLKKGRMHRLLLVSTGALLSPTSTMQGENIPCIAHLVEITAGKEDA